MTDEAQTLDALIQERNLYRDLLVEIHRNFDGATLPQLWAGFVPELTCRLIEQAFLLNDGRR